MLEKRLGEVELEIYHIVCRLEEASVQEVVDEISRERQTAYTSVMTLMKNLSEKGYLGYKKIGKKFIYFPAVNPESLKISLLEKTLDKVFGGSVLDLVQSLVNSEKIGREELAEIRQILNDLEEE
ncbi:MAG: BlaI/MecI/CopY family transcriptional regulator [Calditrichae bacterium]|nr:BlaI/MecI/CopY family transcriptional regulator [Calditrichota bacterium]MCB9089501.1 BlaI/MecI/CopY family transcriptional regulator [Calditrichia bacterium]